MEFTRITSSPDHKKVVDSHPRNPPLRKHCAAELAPGEFRHAPILCIALNAAADDSLWLRRAGLGVCGIQRQLFGWWCFDVRKAGSFQSRDGSSEEPSAERFRSRLRRSVALNLPLPPPGICANVNRNKVVIARVTNEDFASQCE